MSETVFEFERDRERQRLVAAMGRRSKSSNQCTILQCPRTGPPYSAVVPPYVAPMMFVTTWAVPYPVAQMSANQQQVTQLINDDQDDKVELLAAKASLYDSREEAADLKERLHLTLRSKDDLEDQLECYKICFDDARLRQEKTARELANLRRDANQKRIGQVRTTFANGYMGNKIERLAKDAAVGLQVLAHACVAQHRKMTKLLTTLKNRFDRKVVEQEASEAKHYVEIAALQSALANIEAELTHSREETALFRHHAQKLEEHIAAQQKSRAEAESKVITFEKKIATLTKKQARSKEISAKLYEEKKQLQEERSFGECSVCFDDGHMMTFVPCGHAAVCVKCGAEIATCPICTAPVKARAPLYFCV